MAYLKYFKDIYLLFGGQFFGIKGIYISYTLLSKNMCIEFLLCMNRVAKKSVKEGILSDFSEFAV